MLVRQLSGYARKAAVFSMSTFLVVVYADAETLTDDELFAVIVGPGE
jgi:hypothetical protein